MDESNKSGGFMDKLRGGMSTREGVREGAIMMALFMEEFTAVGFTRSEVVQMITGMMTEAMRARRKPAGAGPKESPDASSDAQC